MCVERRRRVEQKFLQPVAVSVRALRRAGKIALYTAVLPVVSGL